MPFRLPLDESVETELINRLDELGHNVKHVDESKELGKCSSDDQIAEYSLQQNRIIVTYDDDFTAKTTQELIKRNATTRARGGLLLNLTSPIIFAFFGIVIYGYIHYDLHIGHRFLLGPEATDGIRYYDKELLIAYTKIIFGSGFGWLIIYWLFEKWMEKQSKYEDWLNKYVKD